MDTLTLRLARPEDAPALRDIYAPYVRETAISFEYDVPSIAEFTQRIERTLIKYPYLAAESDGELLGYAYAGPFHERPAYQWAAEATVYVKRGSHKRGVGKRLYQTLEDCLRRQNICTVNACVAYPRGGDPYLTTNSADFHRHLGYRQVGEFHNCGYKFGRWYDMIWMEKELIPPPEVPSPVTPFPAVAFEMV